MLLENYGRWIVDSMFALQSRYRCVNNRLRNPTRATEPFCRTHAAVLDCANGYQKEAVDEREGELPAGR
jgi:hypothetical protein